jgi:hypothetical protein
MAGVLALLARRWKLLAAAAALLLAAVVAAVVLERRSQEESTPRLFDLTPAQLRNLRAHVPEYPTPNVLDGLRTAPLKLLLTRECRLAQDSAAADDGLIDAVDAWRIREACGFGPLQPDLSVRRTGERRS